jgi:hypothetical protein
VSRAPGFRIDRDALLEEAARARIVPTLTAIAHALGVPPSTVSRALHGRPGAELLARLRCRFGAAGFARVVTVDCGGGPWRGSVDNGVVNIPRSLRPRKTAR